MERTFRICLPFFSATTFDRPKLWVFQRLISVFSTRPPLNTIPKRTTLALSCPPAPTFLVVVTNSNFSLSSVNGAAAKGGLSLFAPLFCWASSQSCAPLPFGIPFLLGSLRLAVVFLSGALWRMFLHVFTSELLFRQSLAMFSPSPSGTGSETRETN